MGSVAAGTPNWVDISSPDLAGTTRFYQELFGWTADPVPAPEAGGYLLFSKDGQLVAGAGPLMDPRRPPAWLTYIATDNADALAQRVADHGGTVPVAPMDVFDQGRMAVFTDPAGALFAGWQPYAMPGAGLFNAPGALCWNELATRDPDGARAFYPAVFGWTAKDTPADGFTYTEWQLRGRAVGGMIPMTDAWPAQLPPHWLVYFAVADCDAAVATATRFGAQVPVPPRNIPPGRFAVLIDQVGALFAVIALAG